MNPHKALRPDSFHATFFLAYWDTIGDEVWGAVNNAFYYKVIDPCLAKTLIILIPKVDPASQMKDLRPISLSNVI